MKTAAYYDVCEDFECESNAKVALLYNFYFSIL